MTKRTRQNYKNRRFVWLQDVNVKDSYQHEHDIVRNYFAFRSFTYYECKDLIASVVRMRPGYLSGKDNSNLEAGHRFSTLLKACVIREIKV